jgi:hypothetical protein
MSDLRFAFVGRVSTEEMQEPEASRTRQVAKARSILPVGAEIVATYLDIGDTRALPWARRIETGRLLTELRAGTNAWNATVVGEFTRAFGAPIQYSTIFPLLQHFRVELAAGDRRAGRLRVGHDRDAAGDAGGHVEAGAGPDPRPCP